MNSIVYFETLRRHVTSVAWVTATLLLAMIGLAVSRFAMPSAVWPSLVTVMAIVLGSGLIGPEFSSGTLQLIVSKPVSRPVYLLSRFAGVLTAVAIPAGIAFVVEGLTRIVTGAPPAAVAALVNVVAGAALICALLAFFGSFTRAYFNVAIFLLMQICLSAGQGILGLIRTRGGGVGTFLAEHPSIERSLAGIERYLFPERPLHLDGAWLARVLITAAVALALACLLFRRREVPYGGD